MDKAPLTLPINIIKCMKIVNNKGLQQLVSYLRTLVCRGPGSNPWPPVPRSGHSTELSGPANLKRDPPEIQHLKFENSKLGLIESVHFVSVQSPFEPPLDKTNTMACAPSEDSAQADQSLRCPHEESLGPQLPIQRTAKTDQTGRTSRLIRVFAESSHFIGFVMRRLILWDTRQI